VPEGDTVWLTARNLNAALAGSVVTRCDIRVPAFATVDLSGELIHEVVSRGKHLLMRIGDLTVHSHLKMEGSWHLYRPDTEWRRAPHTIRAIIGTADWTAVGYQLGLVEVLPRVDEEQAIGHLGPDLLGADWDADEARRRLLAHPEVPVFVAVLEQRNLAGIGNEYANDLLFLRGLAPTRPVGEVGDIDALTALAHRLLHANKLRATRSMTGDLRPRQTHWVYGRAGLPCRRCGATIEKSTLGPDAYIQRDVYWCPNCQK
jgi:endonuclease-8